MALERVADLIFSGGLVITMEDPVEARPLDLAIADGRIQAIDMPGNLLDRVGPETKVLDVRGKTLMPGLIDSHNHMVHFGEILNEVEIDVSPAKVTSIEEMVDRLSRVAARTAPGKWVQAWGYDDTRLKENRHPTKEDLDRACPDHPVIIKRTCAHVWAVNSIALRLAGITDKTAEPEGGKIARDREGQPNGVLIEWGAIDLVRAVIPHPRPEECARSLEAASRFYISEGLTLVTEAGAGISENPNEASGFQIAWQTRRLIPRVSLGLMEEAYPLATEDRGLGLYTGFGNDFLWIGPAKFVADGGIGARSAVLSQPYEGSKDCGVMLEDVDRLYKRMEKMHRAGFQLSVHAIGDRAIDMVLTGYESILSRYPRPHRHRIEHVSVCPPEFFPRIKKLGLIVVVQPSFLYSFGDSFIKNLGDHRAAFTKPIKSMLENGIIVAGSSDRPASDGNPWLGIWAAIHRTTLSGKRISPEESIPPAQALKLYTRNGAYANCVEDRLGTLSPGKLADIVVLNENPLAMDTNRIKDIRVSMTFINGREVYRANDREP